MGLLDDAIREHLDLKRRRGADPTEVEQAEREALGPVRRDPFEQTDDEFEPSGEVPPAFDQDDDGYEDSDYAPGDEPLGEENDWGDALEPLPREEPLAEAPVAEDPSAAELPAEPESRRPDRDEPVGEPTQVLSAEELDDAFADEGPVPAEPPAGAGAETVEYDVEEALESEELLPGEVDPEAPAEPAPGSDEDVLEETPEFLQDTPDHDRLWFEQRPPKDFDFDG